MASRFKSLFPWSSTIPDNLPRGRSYEPPISSADYLPRPKPPPLQQPSRDAPVERPKTAPQKAATWDASDDPGRTRSGFSMKSPPALQHTSRKNSVSSTRSRRSSIWTLLTPSEAPPPVPDLPHAADLPPLPLSPAVRSFTTSGLSSPSAVSSPTSPTSLRSPKDTPRPSPKPYIDVMAAHTAIMAAKRSRPLIMRDYGEAVADRNIATFGDMASDRPYRTRARPKHIEILVKGDDGMNIGRDTPQNNDAPPPSPGITSIRSFTGPRPGIAYPPRSDSLRSDHTASSDERAIPSIVVQDRRGHTMSPLASPVTSVFEDPQVKALPPCPPTTSPSPSRQAPPPPPSERAPEGERRRSPSVATVRSTSHSKAVPPLPPSRSPSRQASTSSSPPEMASLSDSPRRRARARPEAGMSCPPTSIASRDDALPTRNASSATNGTTYSSSNISLSTANGTATPRTTSPHSVSTRISTHTPSPSIASVTTAASRKRASSRNGSVSYSAFPSYASRESRLSDASTSARRRSGSRSVSRRRDYTGSKGTADLAPMVGRENSVETNVTTKLAPAIQHEDVIVEKTSIQREVVTIETHTHEVHHRHLPVIETEILPTKHYVQSDDGKTLVEIPESQISKHSVSGKEAHDWHVAPGPAPCVPAKDATLPAAPAAPAPPPAPTPPVETATPPIVSLARGEPKSRSRANSTKSVKSVRSMKSHKSTRSRAKSLFQPVLSSKKEYITEAGHPRIEYVWHHPPVVQTEDNQTRPIYIGAGIGDLTSHAYSSDEEEDLAGARFGAAVDEGGLLFKESDYERSGSLPGLGRQPGYDELYEARTGEPLTKEMRKMRR